MRGPLKWSWGAYSTRLVRSCKIGGAVQERIRPAGGASADRTDCFPKSKGVLPGRAELGRVLKDQHSRGGVGNRHVVTTVNLGDFRVENAAHRQPQDELG